MKFKYVDKYTNWVRDTYWYGSKNNIKCEIKPYNNHEYYVMIHDKKTDILFNTLWKSLKFESVELAQEFCEVLCDFYKKTRINEGKGHTGYEKSNNRINLFLEQRR